VHLWIAHVAEAGRSHTVHVCSTLRRAHEANIGLVQTSEVEQAETPLTREALKRIVSICTCMSIDLEVLYLTDSTSFLLALRLVRKKHV
jgi:hypothetical protein